MSELEGASLGIVTLSMAVALPIAWVVSNTIRALYGRQLGALMKARAPKTAAAVPSTLPASAGPPCADGTHAAIIVDAGADSEAAAGAGEALIRTIETRAAAAIRGYTLAGLAFAVTAATFVSLVSDGAVYPYRLLLLTTVFAWPITLTAAIIDDRFDLRRQRQYLAVAAAVAALSIVMPTVSIVSALLVMAVTFTLYVLPPGVIAVFVLRRKTRALGPTVFTFMGLLFAGLLVGVVLGGVYLGGFEADSAVVQRSFVWIMVGLGLIVAGVAASGAAIGSRYLPLVARRYVEKRTNNRMESIHLTWTLVALWTAVHMAIDIGILALVFLVPLGIFRLVSRLAAPVPGPETPAARMLFLRVFGDPQRTDRLLAWLYGRWRHIGPVQMISASDSITANLEPNRVRHFMSGDLASLFPSTVEEIDQRVAAMDFEPDPDGRYRVNEISCHADIWRHAFSELLGVTDVVLMDLRGFTPRRAGCIFELTRLLHHVPVASVVLLSDETTDQPFLNSTIQAAWASRPAISPNCGFGAATVRVVALEGDDRASFGPILWAAARAFAPAGGA